MNARFWIAGLALGFGLSGCTRARIVELTGSRICLSKAQSKGSSRRGVKTTAASRGNGWIEVGVDFNECLSSSCERWLESKCEVSLDQNTLVIESVGTKETNLSINCTDDCRIFSTPASCPLAGSPAEGEYKVKFNGQILGTIQYPLEAEQYCWDKNNNWKMEVDPQS